MSCSSTWGSSSHGTPKRERAGAKLPGLELHVKAEMDPESTYIRQDLDRTFIRPTQAEKT